MTDFAAMQHDRAGGRSTFLLRWLLTALIVGGVLLGGLAIWAQPKVGDDWGLIWSLADAGSLWRFVTKLYLTSGGRLFAYTLAGLAISNETATGIFKVLTVACFLLFSGCVFYLGTSNLPFRTKESARHWLLVAGVLWLGLPVVSDTVVQITGACVYLWPATMGLLFLCFFHRAQVAVRQGVVAASNWAKNIGWLAAGLVTGTCNEQLFAGLVVILFGYGWLLWRDGLLRQLSPAAWWGVAGFILGTLVLVAAPGNYARLDAEGWSSVGVVSMLVRYGMYLGGAYFALGTGDSGRALWMGIAVIALSGTLELGGNRCKEAGIWIAGSLATLTPMLPLVNIASPRTTFLAATFLLIAAVIAFPRKTNHVAPVTATGWLIAYAFAMLVGIDGFVGWVANRAVARETEARENMMQTAAAEGKREAVVPHLATIPSRLTYMLNPDHDAKFVRKLGRFYGLDNSRLDDSATAPKPRSINSLKSMKIAF